MEEFYLPLCCVINFPDHRFEVQKSWYHITEQQLYSPPRKKIQLLSLPIHHCLT